MDEMKFTTAVVLLFLLLASPSIAQNTFSIAPAAGLQFPGCYVKSDKNADKGFKANTFDLEPSFDISLQYNIKNNWLIFAGFQAGNSGFSFKYGDLVANNTVGKVSAGLFTTRWPVGVQKYISTSRWFRVQKRIKILQNLKEDDSNQDDILYLVLFRMKAMAGISIDRKVVSTNERESEDFFDGTYTYTVPHRNNVSAFVGLSFQFFNYLRDGMQLNVFYSQGINDVANVNINYTLNGKTYSAEIRTKGSYFTLQIGYPIRVKSFHPNHQ